MKTDCSNMGDSKVYKYTINLTLVSEYVKNAITLFCGDKSLEESNVIERHYLDRTEYHLDFEINPEMERELIKIIFTVFNVTTWGNLDKHCFFLYYPLYKCEPGHHMYNYLRNFFVEDKDNTYLKDRRIIYVCSNSYSSLNPFSPFTGPNTLVATLENLQDKKKKREFLESILRPFIKEEFYVAV